MTNIIDHPFAACGYAARADEQPVQGVIDRLEELLEKAKRGQIRSFAATIVQGPAVTASVWAMTDGWFQEITAGLATLQFRWMSDNSQPQG